MICVSAGFSDQDMALTLSAADATVMNFRNILNSGSVLLSLSYDTPVCVPALGSLRELFRRIGGLADRTATAALCQRLRQIIDRVKLAGIKRQQRRSPLPADFDPEAVSLRTLREYQFTLEEKARVRRCSA